MQLWVVGLKSHLLVPNSPACSGLPRGCWDPGTSRLREAECLLGKEGWEASPAEDPGASAVPGHRTPSPGPCEASTR